MVEGDDEIKVLGEIYVELESGTYKLIERLSQEKDNQEKALGEFNSVVGEVIFNPLVYEEVAEEVMEMATDQDEALSNQEVVDDSLDDKHVKERRPTRGLESPKKR
ncbi:hypothetical protein Tco_1196867 [Tanacetum coccineum]